MKIYLASNSPRRKELLAGLDIDFEVKVLEGIDESYPQDLPVGKVAEYISKTKANAYKDVIGDDELVITADTIVVLHDKVMGKPEGREDAVNMLKTLSGKTHQVITGVCLTTKTQQRVTSVVSEVTFKELSDEEINYYVDRYKPYDKAGAYGIQEWIGYIGVTGLKGSYFNVMGLPVQRIYQELRLMGVVTHGDKARRE
ncbi:MAG: septum formation protein Maf [Prevotella sp.]|nr:septum formation protein Maf [Prevotella sp.]MBR7053359.1 septum formation protein Maf [Prevotella sp.]